MESAVELRAITLGAAAETDEVAAAAIQLTLFVDRHEVSSVSYTHLTLPTIYSV